MTLKATLEAEKLQAMKARKGLSGAELKQADVRLSAVRAALTALSKLETSFKTRRELTDEEAVAALRKEVAQRVEAARVYGEAGAVDRREKELAEAAVLEAFLPKQLDSAATRELVQAVIAEKGLSGPQAIGQVMGALKSRSDVDKGLASKIARELL